MKTLFKYAGATLAAAFTAVVAVDIAPEVLCPVDPTCRKLDGHEIAVAREYFGDAIDYNRVRVFHRRFLGVVGRANWPMSLNGHIYLPGDVWGPGLAHPAEHRVNLVHELTHVWQVQKRGRSMLAEVASAFFQHGIHYRQIYRYTLRQDARFDSFGFEQQAKIMQDLLRDHQVLRSGTGAAWLQKHCPAIRAREDLAGQSLPLRPEPACRPGEMTK